MVPCILHRAVFAGTLVLIAGCRLDVPIHVWQPPTLESTVGKRVVLQAVAGPQETAVPIKEKLMAMVPSDAGRATTILASEDLEFDTNVQLASATDEGPSDVALASIAKRAGIDYLLRGQVVSNQAGTELNRDRPRDTLDPKQQSSETSESTENPRLILSWRLTSLGDQPSNQGQPIVVDVESSIQRYPDLALLENQNEVLASAAARETFRLITPSVDRKQVQLAIPYAMLGSRDVRRGNLAARSGKWSEAEQIWSKVLDRHPLQAAAAHNLALAAVAGQDFSRAKKLARQAIRLQPTSLHQQTLVWIELKQRDYHKAFQLPDPPEGWFVTQ